MSVGRGHEDGVVVLRYSNKYHAVALAQTRVAAADLRGRDPVGRQRSPDGLPRGSHRQYVGRWRIAVLRFLFGRRKTLVARDRADDLHLIVEPKELRNRFPIPRTGGNLVDPHGVGGPVVGEKDDMIQ